MKFQLVTSMRYKIMLGLLVAITAVVGAITFTMANLFHADKRNYVSDVGALVAAHVASEADGLMDDLHTRLQSYANVVFDTRMTPAIRNALLRQMSADFPDLVYLAAFEGDKLVGSQYDAEALDEAGLGPKDMESVVAPFRAEGGTASDHGVAIANATTKVALPAFTMAIDCTQPKGKRRIATAVVRNDGLMRLIRESKAFNIYLVGPDGTLLAHRDPSRVARHEKVTSVKALKPGAAAEARTYASDGAQVIGGIASTATGGLTTVAEVPESAAYFASRELLGHLATVSLVLLVGAAIVGLLWSRTLTGSIRKLADASKAIGQGHFDVQVDVRSNDEIGTLAGSFNRMASELDAREKQLKTAQAQLIQSEKMAAFGQLGAGFAHEIKNPLAGILGLVQINKRLAAGDEKLLPSLETMEKETKRCKAIIDNLLKFARQEKVAHEPIDLHKVLDDAAAIMRHQLGIHRVQLNLEMPDDLPSIVGNANQLQQVLMNLILNAQQAMKGEPGEVWISAREANGRVEVCVRDNGPGIPRETQLRIFEPFFTTKQAGEGTGLGLSVSFGIIKDHQGEIRVESEPGQGTAFFIDLPAATASTGASRDDAADDTGSERMAA